MAGQHPLGRISAIGKLLQANGNPHVQSWENQMWRGYDYFFSREHSGVMVTDCRWQLPCEGRSERLAHCSSSPFINFRSVTEKTEFDSHDIGASREINELKGWLHYCSQPSSLSSMLIPRKNIYITSQNYAWWGVPKPFVLIINSQKVRVCFLWLIFQRLLFKHKFFPLIIQQTEFVKNY